MKPQTRKILRWMELGRPLTPLLALRKFGCFRLAARIYELRAIGYKISINSVFRGRKRFASYRLF